MSDLIVRPSATHVDPMMANHRPATTTLTSSDNKNVDNQEDVTTTTTSPPAPLAARNLNPIRRSEVIAECVRQGYFRTPSCNDKLHLHFKGYNSFESKSLDDYTDCKVLWMEGNCFSDESFHSSVVVATNTITSQEEKEDASSGASRRFEEHPDGRITGGPNLLKSQSATLRSLYLHQNLLTTFPSVASACQRLDSINISDNFITTLSDGGLVTPAWMWPVDVLSAIDDIVADRGGASSTVPIPTSSIGCRLDQEGLWNLLIGDGSVDCATIVTAARELSIQSIRDERVRAAERMLDEEQRMVRLSSYGKQLQKNTAATIAARNAAAMVVMTAEGAVAAVDAEDASLSAPKQQDEDAEGDESGTNEAAATLRAALVLQDDGLEAMSPFAQAVYSHHGVFGWVPLSVGLWGIAVKKLIMTEGLLLLPPPAAEQAVEAADGNNNKSTSPSKSRLREQQEEADAEAERAATNAFLTELGGGSSTSPSLEEGTSSAATQETYGVTSRIEYLKRYRRACQLAVHLRKATYPFCATALPGGGVTTTSTSTTTATGAEKEKDTTTTVSPPESIVNTLTWIQMKNNHLKNPVELLPLLLCARLSALDVSGNRISDSEALLLFLEHAASIGMESDPRTLTPSTQESEGNDVGMTMPNSSSSSSSSPTAATASSTPASSCDASTPFYHLKSLMLQGNPAVRGITQYRKRVLSMVVGFTRHGGGGGIGIDMVGPDGSGGRKVIPRGLSYLDDRPVFDTERRLVVAWAVGGMEGEKKEREQIKHEEDNAVQQRLKDFKALMRRAAAAAGVTVRSNSATASDRSSMGGMITIEDDDGDEERPTSSEDDDEDDEEPVRLVAPDNKSTTAATQQPPRALTSNLLSQPTTTTPTSSTAAAADVLSNDVSPIPIATTSPSLTEQAAQRAQEAASRHGIVILDDIDEEEEEEAVRRSDALAP